MAQLTPESLWSLEQYAKKRQEFRAQVIAHKKRRSVPVGPHVTLLFEDETTIRYQVQEMLRIERIFEEEGIAHELEAYNPLIPDGTNLKATMLIEYPDPAERAARLRELKGIEDVTYVRVAGFDPVYAIADEDLVRETEEKTSSVHFLRFELTPDMIAALKKGAALGVGIEHPRYSAPVDALPAETRAALVADLA
ncbi:MAG: DUF3501 family protein [Pseudomonadota bacterium]